MRRELRIFQGGSVPMFGADCLPLTMELARLARGAIEPALVDHGSHEWTYEDRVLVRLVPALRENVIAFVDGTGEDMATIFQPHQIVGWIA